LSDSNINKSVEEMLTKVLQGIPFLVDPVSKRIFAFEKPLVGEALCLGTYDPVSETFQLVENWKELYQGKLENYRQTEKVRSRLPKN
jgi:hypothetical protein